MNTEFLEKSILSQMKQYKKEQIVFWGASKFLKNFLANPIIKEYNIAGIVDNDKRKWNTSIEGYKIFSHEHLKTLKPICIIDTILNDYSINYEKIKNIVNSNYNSSDIKLLPKSVLTNVKCKDFEYINFTKKEVENYENCGSEYKQYSEMHDIDRLFISSLLQRFKPKKILEVGVSNGGSSYLILNTIKNFKNNKLYSLDYNTNHYLTPNKKTGFLMDNYPDLKKNWVLKTGGLALNFLDEISSSVKEKDKFDFVFIDTMHLLPGEILDFLQVLPYMKKDSILVFHDTNLQIADSRCIVNNVLMSSIEGKKIIPYPEPYYNYLHFNNIGAIKLNKNTFSHLYEIFNLLTLPWYYMPSEKDLTDLTNFFERHYPEYYTNYFKEVVFIQKRLKENN